MTDADPLSAELQRLVAERVAAAVAAERERIADEIRALLVDSDALRAWLATHGLGVGAGPGATLAVLQRELRGACGMCDGLAEFVESATD